jgi:hypothetical protein
MISFFLDEEGMVVSGFTSTILAAPDVRVALEQRSMPELMAVSQRWTLSKAFWLPSGW